jgi:hypothetical protein
VAGDQVREVVRERAQLVTHVLLELFGRDVRRQLRQRGALLAGSVLSLAIERAATLVAVPGAGARAVGARRVAPLLPGTVAFPVSVRPGVVAGGRTALTGTTVVAGLAAERTLRGTPAVIPLERRTAPTVVTVE